MMVAAIRLSEETHHVKRFPAFEKFRDVTAAGRTVPVDAYRVAHPVARVLGGSRPAVRPHRTARDRCRTAGPDPLGWTTDSERRRPRRRAHVQPLRWASPRTRTSHVSESIRAPPGPPVSTLSPPLDDPTFFSAGTFRRATGKGSMLPVVSAHSDGTVGQECRWASPVSSMARAGECPQQRYPAGRVSHEGRRTASSERPGCM